MRAVPLVSVVIPTYNRLRYVRNAVESVLAQTHSELEIIVVDDGSTEPGYLDLDLGERVQVIRLEENSRTAISAVSPAAHTRNVALNQASGAYVAFLDDDDWWLPHKIERQLEVMERTGCGMSCTEGLFGHGPFDPNVSYPAYNGDEYLEVIRAIHRRKRSRMMDGGFPPVWSRTFVQVHNSIIASSVVLSRRVVQRTGLFRPDRPVDDYEYWLRALEHTDCAYVDEPCVYYDNAHGDGSYC